MSQTLLSEDKFRFWGPKFFLWRVFVKILLGKLYWFPKNDTTKNVYPAVCFFMDETFDSYEVNLQAPFGLRNRTGGSRLHKYFSRFSACMQSLMTRMVRRELPIARNLATFQRWSIEILSKATRYLINCLCCFSDVLLNILTPNNFEIFRSLFQVVQLRYSAASV